MKNIFKKYYEYVAAKHEEVMEQYVCPAEKTFSGQMNYGNENRKHTSFKLRKEA